MVCTANDLQGWTDFPKGLRVLLLEEDGNSAAEIRSKLEKMDYVVYTYYNQNEALSAISRNPESFHVAIVEVRESNSDGSFRILETARDLPTIMTSEIHCLSTMMKCIALGAVEFLLKPLSEEKLRNIWQHVLHKACNAGGGINSNSLSPIKESVTSMLQLPLGNGEDKRRLTSSEPSLATENLSDDNEQARGSGEYPAPSTPQLNQGARLLDDGDCQDQNNCATGKEPMEQEAESKSVENTRENSLAEATHPAGQNLLPEKKQIKEEDDFADRPQGESCMSSYSNDREGCSNIDGTSESRIKSSETNNNPSGSRAGRKKMKVLEKQVGRVLDDHKPSFDLCTASQIDDVDWTPELHKKFVQAVEQLGVDQAIPSRILELMKVESLTRHNVASHLQKYRMQKRHSLAREEDRRWPHPRDSMKRSYQAQKPIIMAFHPYHSNHVLPVTPVYPIWGQPGGHLSRVQMWTPSPPPGCPSWPQAEVHADAWGCPVMTPPHCPYYTQPQQVSEFYGSSSTWAADHRYPMLESLQPAEEVIDGMVKEAMSKPWLPLPLGLKPPSTESVLSELSRQGISTIPPQSHINGSRPF